MENIDGFATRQKIYNKMVQIIECKSARILWDADARDKANERGLTRAEVTFYASSIISCDKLVDNVGIFHPITSYMDSLLQYV